MSTRILYLVKLSFKSERDIKAFLGKPKLRKCPAKNAKGSRASQNERTLDCNLKPYEEIKISVSVNM